MVNFRLSDKSYFDHYLELFDELKFKITGEPDDYIIAQPLEDLIKYYRNSSFNPIEFDIDKNESIIHEKYIKIIPSGERDGPYKRDGDLKVECEKIIVKLPILPNKDINIILSLRTQTISLSGGSKFSVSGNYIIFDVEIKGYGINCIY
jgi:GDP-D-mannose dehydratase